MAKSSGLSVVALTALYAAFRAGSETALGEIVQANLGLVYVVAKRYYRVGESHGYSREDVVAAGRNGLLEAAIRFMPEEGNAFSTFAMDQIRAGIQQGLKLTRTATIEVEAYNALTGETETRKVKRARPMVSIDAPVSSEGENEATLGDTMQGGRNAEDTLLARQDEENGLTAEEMVGEFEATLSNERELMIWRHRVITKNLEMNYNALGCKSAARVSQIRSDLVARFKEYIEARG